MRERHMQFVDMAPIVPEGEKGEAKVVHLNIGKPEAGYTQLRAIVTGGRDAPISQGTYVQLYVNGAMVMSDTQMERRSNYGVIFRATGDVLIAGLGVGMILMPLLANPEVKTVTVIEKSQDAIDLVEEHIRNAAGADGDKLKVICADIFKWKPPKGQKWDTIYFDIWTDICTDSLDDMAKLHRKFARRKTSPGAWMDSWKKAELKLQRDRDRRQEAMWRG